MPITGPGRTFRLTGAGVTVDLNTATPDAFGTFWFAVDVDGWDSPDLRQKLQDRQAEHGVVVTESLLGARLLTVKQGIAFCTGTSEQARWDAIDRILVLANLLNGATGTLQSTEGSFVRQVGVQRGSTKPIVTPLPEGDASGYGHIWPFRFQFEFLATDPRRYSAVEHAGVALPASVTNAGDFPTKPVVTVTGGGQGTAITLGSQSVTLTSAYGAVPSPLTLDFLAQTAVDNSSNNQIQAVTGPSQWWSLAAGANAVTFTGPGSATIAWRDAWS